jgi:hypothetical protein
MPIVSADCDAFTAGNRPASRVLRWTFRRREVVIVFQLGLTGDHSAYELRIDPPWNPLGVTTEVFDDAMSAFHRHAAIEQMLVTDGWMLEEFESEKTFRNV